MQLTTGKNIEVTQVSSTHGKPYSHVTIPFPSLVSRERDNELLFVVFYQLISVNANYFTKTDL